MIMPLDYQSPDPKGRGNGLRMQRRAALLSVAMGGIAVVLARLCAGYAPDAKMIYGSLLFGGWAGVIVGLVWWATVRVTED